MSPTVFAAACLLLAGPVLAEKRRGASLEQVEFARRFIATPTDRLPPEDVEAFLALEPASLPQPLVRAVRAKRLELRTLMRLSRSEDAVCPRPVLDDARDPAVLKLAGYAEIGGAEEGFLRRSTGLDMEGLACRSSFQSLAGKKGRRYFLHLKDPLWRRVAERRVEPAGAPEPAQEAAAPEWRPDGWTQSPEGEGVRATIGLGCGCSGEARWLNERNRGCYREERNCRSPWGGDPTEPCRLCP